MIKRLRDAAFLICFFALLLYAQEYPKIPGDLLIKVSHQRAWSGGYSEMTINAKGEISYLEKGGLPVGRNQLGIMPPGKPTKYLIPHAPRQKLRKLLSEFERIQFSRLAKEFPGGVEKTGMFITDMGSESISIRMNGLTIETPNYLGYVSPNARTLRHLAHRIRGIGIWNYKGGEIPENFLAQHRTTTGRKVDSEFWMDADGKIKQTFYSFDKRIGMPVNRREQVVGKLSKSQIRGLIDSLEAANFSMFRYSELSKDYGCSNDPPLTEEKRSHIYVQINRISQMYATLYENCNALSGTEAAYFEEADRAIKTVLKAAGVFK